MKLTKTLSAKIRAHMFRNYRDHVDTCTGILDCTGLAEDAASMFPDLYADNGDLPEELFDIAFSVYEHLAKLGRVTTEGEDMDRFS